MIFIVHNNDWHHWENSVNCIVAIIRYCCYLRGLCRNPAKWLTRGSTRTIGYTPTERSTSGSYLHHLTLCNIHWLVATGAKTSWGFSSSEGMGLLIDRSMHHSTSKTPVPVARIAPKYLGTLIPVHLRSSRQYVCWVGRCAIHFLLALHLDCLAIPQHRTFSLHCISTTFVFCFVQPTLRFSVTHPPSFTGRLF
jgi:hypothetical protein